MTQDRLAELLSPIAEVRCLVLGDAMLDEYIWGVAERISPEAPVMVVRRERITRVPGGAANVINCVRALGARAGIVAVVGADSAGEDLARKLHEAGADPIALLVAEDRPTTLKTRVVAHSQQVVRIDHELRGPLPADLAQRLGETAAESLDGCDGLLLSDYDKGVLTPESIPALLATAGERGVRVAVNAKPRCAEQYRGVELVTVNRVEAEALCGFSPDTPDSAGRAAEAIGTRLGTRLVLVTLGGQGAVLWSSDGGTEHLPPVPIEVYDTAGAGDTTIAATHLALCAGATPREAVELAMRAAAVVVKKVGVQTASPGEIQALGT